MGQKGQTCRLLLSCMLLIVLTVTHSLENERIYVNGETVHCGLTDHVVSQLFPGFFKNNDLRKIVRILQECMAQYMLYPSNCDNVNVAKALILKTPSFGHPLLRAVTEHQLMHDRGRSIQSLKRLIWLSSAIERLHTADTRSLSSSLTSPDDDDDEGNEDSSKYHPVMDSIVQQGALEMLLREMYRAQPPSGRNRPTRQS